jgi:hypothetical protein
VFVFPPEAIVPPDAEPPDADALVPPAPPPELELPPDADVVPPVPLPQAGTRSPTPMTDKNDAKIRPT